MNKRRSGPRAVGPASPALSARSMKSISSFAAIALCVLPGMPRARAGNPIIDSLYTADPSAHVFNGRLYLYPSHDRNDSKTWDMTDWHVYSSDDLVHWKDHGVALALTDIPFGRRFAWAPDCAEKDGKYYFYFPVSLENRKNTDRIGVAVGDSPAGPFKCVEKPVLCDYPRAFDPCVFKDDDGSYYLVSGQGKLYVGKLKSDMLGLAEETRETKGATGFFEGSWMHKYKGRYYVSYASTRHTIAYATSDSPYGPFVFKGDILKDIPDQANTTHHSIVEYKGRWYIFYHSKKLATDRREPLADYKRSVCIDVLEYNDDGTIRPVRPTLEGVRATDADGTPAATK